MRLHLLSLRGNTFLLGDSETDLTEPNLSGRDKSSTPLRLTILSADSLRYNSLL